jgi:hypothetical protein
MWVEAGRQGGGGARGGGCGSGFGLGLVSSSKLWGRGDPMSFFSRPPAYFLVSRFLAFEPHWDVALIAHCYRFE